MTAINPSEQSLAAPECAVDLPLLASSEIEDSGLAFHFNLPDDGLALREVNINDGVVKLRFTASPKVPTLTEEDVATVFRLASEGKRPEFFYIGIPPWHPFYGRQYKQYIPEWLRGTSVGETLSEADWNMKCLHVGARSNEDKTEFRAWQTTSQLDGLATHLDFPNDKPPGSIIMSCELAKIQKSDSELVFPEEPKMTIVDDSSSVYTKYITEIYPSVAYHDEPRFLKMQELVKMILAAEWLIEKGVKISKEWTMQHTTKPRETARAIECASNHTKPPKELIPLPINFKRPTTDVTVKTWEADQYRWVAEQGVKRRYGYSDFDSTEGVMFTKDGTLCHKQQSLKMVWRRKITVAGQLAFETPNIRLYFPLPPNTPTPSICEELDESLKELPENSQEYVTSPVHMAVDIEAKCKIHEGGVELALTKSLRPCAPLTMPQIEETTTMKMSIDNLDKLLSDEDPKMSIRPGIPGLCEEVVPNVESWEELHSELTVPWPRIWQEPYIGVGVPTASGGVTTSHIPVREERFVRTKGPTGETVRMNGFKREGRLLDVEAQRHAIYGTITPANPKEFAQVSGKFTRVWNKGTCPLVDSVFVITNPSMKQKWSNYKQKLTVSTVEDHYHGTTLCCDITRTQQLCRHTSCGICGISSEGLQCKFIRKNIDFQRFGHGFYLAPNSSKCHDYTEGQPAYGYRAMLLCDVCPGRRYPLETNSQQLTGPPTGFDSVYGKVGTKLNYPELVVYDTAAVMPRYIIVYRKDGVSHPLAN